MERRLAFFVLLAAVASLLMLSACSVAKTVYVKYDSPTDGPGTSWSNAYHRVTNAILTASAGDSLWVARGTYNESFRIDTGIAVYGGFAGTESNLTDRPAFPRPAIDPSESILDGTNMSDSTVRMAASASSATRLDGFTVANGVGHYDAGSARSYGGGIMVYNACSAVIINNTIKNNYADKGGGIYVNYDSQPTITQNNIIDNDARTVHGQPDDQNGHGGGIYVYNCYGTHIPNITSNLIKDNFSYHRGGGIMCYGSDPIIANNIIDSNSTGLPEGWEWYGGGIYCINAAAKIVNNTICGNTAECGAGAIYLDGASSASLSNNIIYGNNSGIGRDSGVGYVTLRNNDVVDGYAGVSPGTGDINVNPGFVDYAAHNFHLAAGSPCINAGWNSATGIQSTDFEGDTRIIDGTVDIGADEFNSSVTPLSNNSPITRSTIPANFSFPVVANKWAAVGIAPTTDHDIKVATDQAFASVLQSSTYGGTVSDIVLTNGHYYGNTTQYAQVYFGTASNYSIEAECYPTDLTLGTAVSGTFGTDSVFDLYETDLVAGTKYGAIGHITSGTLGLGIYIYNPSRSSGKIGYADEISGGEETPLVFTAPETGTYAFLVVRSGGSGSYTFGVTGPVTISGTVQNFSGTPMSLVAVNATNGGGSTGTGLGGGPYTLTVPPLWSGTLTPSRAGYAFIPVSRSYTQAMGNRANQDFTGGSDVTIGAAKQLNDGSSVCFTDVIRTSAFGATFYVEQSDRTSGLLVMLTPGHTSTKLCVGGVLSTLNGERRLTSPLIDNDGTGSVGPLHCTNRDLGGSQCGPTATGVTGATGLNNVGLLIRTEGVVTGVYSDGFTIDDGSKVSDYSPRVGVTVSLENGVTAPSVGKFVTVTGISSVGTSGGNTYRVIRPKSSSDVVVIQ